jgi:hypothetical protein
VGISHFHFGSKTMRGRFTHPAVGESCPAGRTRDQFSGPPIQWTTNRADHPSSRPLATCPPIEPWHPALQSRAVVPPKPKPCHELSFSPSTEAEHGSGDSTADVDVQRSTQYPPEWCGLCADRALHLRPVIRSSALSRWDSVVGDR